MIPTQDRVFITSSAVVYPAQCDAMGHLTVKEYMGFLDQAERHCFLAPGFDPSWIGAEGIGRADVRHLVIYESEPLAGALVRAKSRVLKVGTKSLTTAHKLIDATQERVCATLEAISVQYDLAHQRAIPLHDEVRRTALSKLGDDAKPSDHE